jgi:outer membrane protein TolC
MATIGRAGLWLAVLTGALFPSGCSWSPDKKVSYIGTPEPEEVISSQFHVIDPPEPETDNPGLAFSVKPRTIADRSRDEIWDLSLAEAMHLALINNKIARTRNDFLSPGNQLLLSPDGVISVYDPAIRDTGFLFGTRGVESAQSVFDPIFSTNATFGTNATTQNNLFTSAGIPPGGVLNQDQSQLVTSLTKQMGYGAQFGIANTVNYSDSNQNTAVQLFPSVFTGNLQFTYNQPLLAGSGTDFNRISGPIGSSIQGVSGLNQGVVIARINTDISLMDFEIQVRNMIHDVEDLYWELYLAYQNYHSLVTSRNASLKLWQAVQAKFGEGLQGGGRSEEAQAREQYFEARARVEAALGGPAGRGGEQGIYGLELQLRRICGLSANDGKVIRPSDEPSVAQMVHNWDVSLATAFSRRQELRKQKWNIKSIELQLRAAKNLARPQFNFVSSYQVNGFGQHVFGDNGPVGSPVENLTNYTRNLVQANQTGWNVGFQFAVPLGLRNAHAQVRNTELRLMKAQSVLESQEMEVNHEIASTFQALDYWYQNMQTNYNRRQAALDNLEAAKNDYDVERKALDLVLQAQNRQTIADLAFYRSVVEYNKALAELQLRQGTLLDYNNIHLAERDWTPDALIGASRLARARSFAFDAPRGDPVHHEPEAFVPRPRGTAVDAHELIELPPDLGSSEASPLAGRPMPEGKARINIAIEPLPADEDSTEED